MRQIDDDAKLKCKTCCGSNRGKIATFSRATGGWDGCIIILHVVADGTGCYNPREIPRITRMTQRHHTCVTTDRIGSRRVSARLTMVDI